MDRKAGDRAGKNRKEGMGQGRDLWKKGRGVVDRQAGDRPGSSGQKGRGHDRE